MVVETDANSGPATDRLVAHFDRGECYAGNYTGEDFGPAAGRVIEAAHALIGATTHVNVSGAEYRDRKAYYALLRRSLNDPALASLLASFGLLPAAVAARGPALGDRNG